MVSLKSTDEIEKDNKDYVKLFVLYLMFGGFFIVLSIFNIRALPIAVLFLFLAQYYDNNRNFDLLRIEVREMKE